MHSPTHPPHHQLTTPAQKQCADITFRTTAPSGPDTCTNQTGITAEFLPADQYVLANATDPEAEHGHGGGHGDGEEEEDEDESSSSSSGGSSSSDEESGAAGLAQAKMAVGWTVLGAGVLGAAALL